MDVGNLANEKEELNNMLKHLQQSEYIAEVNIIKYEWIDVIMCIC